jgi:hypothetical protein
MSSIPIEKIKTILTLYRAKLVTAEQPPIDYAACMRLSAQISLLEDLFYIAHQSTSQPPARVPQTCAHLHTSEYVADGSTMCHDCGEEVSR